MFIQIEEFLEKRYFRILVHTDRFVHADIIKKCRPGKNTLHTPILIEQWQMRKGMIFHLFQALFERISDRAGKNLFCADRIASRRMKNGILQGEEFLYIFLRWHTDIVFM